MRPHEAGADEANEESGLSLEENGSSGNPGRSAPGPTALVAPGPGIALWWCDLQASPARLRTCETHLSQAEQARASRFGMKRLRDRYVIGRGALRAILGRELGVDPAEVAIVRGKRGRPELAGVPTLDFNISHTDSVAIVALVRHGRVGVDIERLDRVINVVGIVRKFLTDHERLELAGSEADAARRRVLTLWTCKEAMSKATGDALSAPFGSIDVDLRGRPALRGGPGVYRPGDWSLHPAAVPSAYVSTIALWHPG